VVLPLPNIDTLCIDTRKAGVTPAFLFAQAGGRTSCALLRAFGANKK
jgi:hypothetical protein